MPILTAFSHPEPLPVFTIVGVAICRHLMLNFSVFREGQKFASQVQFEDLFMESHARFCAEGLVPSCA